MPLYIIRDDITMMETDAIVNPTDEFFSGSGGTDYMIHRIAGEELEHECRDLPLLKTGQCAATGAYNLQCRYIIHTVGPIWDYDENPDELLRNCYRNSLNAAKERECESVAFPLISSGTFGCPKDTALTIATEEISAFLMHNDMTVYIVVYDREAVEVSRELMGNIKEYIYENYVSIREENIMMGSIPGELRAPSCVEEPVIFESFDELCCNKALPLDFDNLGESFQHMLFRKIDERGISDSDCYNKANIDRRLFSKLKNPGYTPNKKTVLALCIALELNIEETEELLDTLGYSLSKSIKFDVIIRYFIEKGIFNIFTINSVLFANDQQLLGAKAA
ncbi:MAG: macro domain-containing protein [Clostridia bacterium]|nr:macro domain-containing protein [Clostridia bacterium]